MQLLKAFQDGLEVGGIVFLAVRVTSSSGIPQMASARVWTPYP